MFYDCVVCLGGPCNEVHGMLLFIDTSQCSDVYIFVCLYMCVCVTFLIAQCKACLHLSGCMLSSVAAHHESASTGLQHMIMRYFRDTFP